MTKIRLSMARIVIGPLLAAISSTAIAATEMPTLNDAEVQACIDKSMPTESLRQRLTLRASDNDGVKSESSGEMFWRRNVQNGARATIRLSLPASRAGLTVLVAEREGKNPDMYLYVPDLGRTRKVTGKQIATGMLESDFSYEEFSHLQSIAGNAETQRIADQVLAGRAAYVLQTTPLEDTSVYARIVTFIDQEQCIPVQTQFIAPNGEIRKELIATRDAIKQIGDRFVPHHVVMHDRDKDTRTELIVEDVEIDVEIGDAVFNPKSLGKAF